MKQLLQNIRTGDLTLEEVPAPACLPGGVVVRNHFSVISAGTERATLQFARQSLLGKARSRPDLVRQVLAKAKRDGLKAAFDAAMQRLSAPSPLGYSSAGDVIEAGEYVSDLVVGDLVACAGAGYASHAEVVYVPANLAAKLPNGVLPRQGAFATLGAIALQGIHRAELTPGEYVAVIGLGLIGQLTVQLLHAYGFPVLGLDTSPVRVVEASRWGMQASAVIGRDDVENAARAFSEGHGVDAVIITASTSDSGPVQLAGAILRERGRVSVVGDVGMDVPRRVYYGKELDLRVSRSYGPGRYDPSYEEYGLDYPLPYVRWTERRNIQEFLRLVSAGRVDVDRMVTHTYPFAQAHSAYRQVVDNPRGRSFLGVLLEYPQGIEQQSRRIEIRTSVSSAPKTGTVGVGLVGAGSFAQGTILPVLARLDGVRLVGVATASGRNAAVMAKRYGAAYATTDYHHLLADPDIDLVIIATRHGQHAQQAVDGLHAGKNVHVEKPLALTVDDLRAVAQAAEASSGRLHVGFNRRFAPLSVALKEHFSGRSTPLLMHYRVNAGHVPSDSWVHDPLEGGGRILGEVCHFVDLLGFLSGSQPVSVSAVRLEPKGEHVLPDDNVTVMLEFEDGSQGTVLYSALGGEVMPKELVEVLAGGRSATLDNYQKLMLYRGSSRSERRGTQDKGHAEQFQALVKAIRDGKPAPVPLQDLLTSSLATLLIKRSLMQRQPVMVDLSLLRPLGS